jgi:hypothetical protein
MPTVRPAQWQSYVFWLLSVSTHAFWSAVGPTAEGLTPPLAWVRCLRHSLPRLGLDIGLWAISPTQDEPGSDAPISSRLSATLQPLLSCAISKCTQHLCMCVSIFQSNLQGYVSSLASKFICNEFELIVALDNWLSSWIFPLFIVQLSILNLVTLSIVSWPAK